MWRQLSQAERCSKASVAPAQNDEAAFSFLTLASGRSEFIATAVVVRQPDIDRHISSSKS